MQSCTGSGCLILACGNLLRGDDGAAWHLVEALRKTTAASSVRIIVQQQWTAELAQDIAGASSVLFLDCAVTQPAGSVTLTAVAPGPASVASFTHHQDAPSLLALARSLYGRVPTHCAILLMGAHSIKLSESLSPLVESALPRALDTLLAWIDLYVLSQPSSNPT